MSLLVKALLGVLCLGGMALVGCQYEFGRGELSKCYQTMMVPYIEGDQRGELTNEVIKKLVASGAFRYVERQGDLTLQVKLIDFRDENIGFRYDRKKRGKLKKSLIPTEMRVDVVAEVLILETGTDRVVRGPTRITASVEFDHTYYASRHKENVFSLGQLSDIDAARDAAMQPLNRCLAERIIDYVINSW